MVLFYGAAGPKGIDDSKNFVPMMYCLLIERQKLEKPLESQ